MAAAKTAITNLRTIVLATTLALLVAGSLGMAQQVSADGGNTITFTAPASTKNSVTFVAPTNAQITLAPPPSDAGTVTLLAPEPNTGDSSLSVIAPASVEPSADTGTTSSRLTGTGN